MSKKSEKESERSKLMQEKCQNLITTMLKDEDNKYCVDCDAKGPRWASWNLGVFLCIRCAGIHRNLGVHITRVKSVNLDTWTPEQVVSLQQMGNSRARAVYEAQLPDGFRRPQTDAALESFIRAKYEQKKYVAKEWVPSPPPKVDWDREIEEELEKQKRKKKALASGSSVILGSLSSPNIEKKAPASKPTPIPAPLPKPKSNAHSPKTGRTSLEATSNATAITSTSSSNNSNGGGSNTLDLLGLSAPSVTTTSAPAAVPSSVKDSSNGANSDDEFNNFFSANSKANGSNLKASPKVDNNGKVEPKSLAQEEADFFNQSVPSEAEKAKLTKDSIMALYGSKPASGAATIAPTNPVANSGAPTSNLSLLAGLGSGGGFPAHFAQPTSTFPTQGVAGAGHLGHFGGPATNAGAPHGQFGGQFGQMQPQQSQFINGANGGFNQFNSNNHHQNGSMGMVAGHQQVHPQQQQQQPGGMNFFPSAGGLGGFQQAKGGFNLGHQPGLMGGVGGAGPVGMPQMMGGNGVVGGGAQMPFMGAQGTTGLNGNSGGFMQGGVGIGGQMMMPNAAAAAGAGSIVPQGQATNTMQQQFGGLNLGNVWQ